MATLQVRDIDDRLYSLLKTSARLRNRSISQEVISILEAYINAPRFGGGNSTLEFLSLTGAWQDDRPAEEIVRDLRKGRKPSDRFGEDHGLFD